MVRKRLILNLLAVACCFFLIPFQPLKAQPGTWAISAGSAAREFATDVLVDAAGNAYVTGFYRDSIDFGATRIYSEGNNDFFLAKYDVNGSLQWVNNYGWFENEFPRVMTFDLDGNILLAGEFQDSTIFGNDTLYSLDTLWYGPYAQTYDVFVIEVTPQGQQVKVFADGWFSSERFYDIEVDQHGNRVFAATWHTFSWWEYGWWGHGFHDAMVVALDSDAVYMGGLGNNLNFKHRAHVWGNHFDEAREVEILGDSIYVLAGTFQDTTWYEDSAAFSVTNFEDDIFVVAFDTLANYKWHVAGGSKGKDRLTGMVSDAVGNIYICGTFDSAFTIGGQSSLGAGLLDGFVAGLDPNGNLQWLTTVGGPRYDGLEDMEFASNGDLIITGNFQGEITLGSYTLTASDSLNQDIFVASISPSGTVNWAWSGGGDDQEEAHAVDVDGAGYIYVHGVFNGTAVFGQASLTAAGSDDLFLFRMNSTGSVPVEDAYDALQQSMTLYPNPTRESVTLRMELERPGTVQVELLDLQGKTVRRWEGGKRVSGWYNQELQVGDLPGGSYFVKVRHGNQSAVQKLMLLN